MAPIAYPHTQSFQLIVPEEDLTFKSSYIAAGRAHFHFDNADDDTVVTAGNIVLYRPKEFQKYEYYGIDKTEVYWVHFTGSAKEMSQDEIKSIKDDIKKKYPDYTVELSENVDDSLLGGYVVKTKMEEYDKSFTWRLSQLERKMTGR